MYGRKTISPRVDVENFIVSWNELLPIDVLAQNARNETDVNTRVDSVRDAERGKCYYRNDFIP
jgi:hypothetical protein